MKVISVFVILSFVCFTGVGQEKESEEAFKPLTKHFLGFETRAFTGNGGLVVSYRYLLNNKWNLLVSGSAVSRDLSLGLRNKVVEIVDSISYVYSDLYNHSTTYEYELGVERNFSKDKIDFFIGGSGRFIFDQTSTFENLYLRTVGDDLNSGFLENDLGNYNQKIKSNSIGLTFSLGLKYSLTRRLKLLLRMENALDIYLDNANLFVGSDTYYKGSREEVNIYEEDISLYNRFNIGLMHQF